MPAFIDATCQRCGRRFGWMGEVTDPAPTCPGCGFWGWLDRNERKTIESQPPQPRTPDGFFMARRRVGLSFGQAVEVLAVSRDELMRIEDGSTDPNEQTLARMKEAYRISFL